MKLYVLQEKYIYVCHMIMLSIDKDVIIVYDTYISLSLSNKANIMGHETMFAYKSSYKFPNLLPKM
jgi:hypothetical protein